uniref:Uncharacterized protein LOC104228206 n=1 Tax=Nicotiana sylvestris TaxID=4096 RepID=A0A1U7WK55_NICSY|nr:PREDICTED: uncharacterized protein LOC104228206 [Nicotiana sylvestris]
MVPRSQRARVNGHRIREDLRSMATAFARLIPRSRRGRGIPGSPRNNGVRITYDNPEDDDKCWTFCVSDCELGGACKLEGNKHVCHCKCA